MAGTPALIRFLMKHGFAPLFAAYGLESEMRSVSRPVLAALRQTLLRLGVAAALLGGPALAADTGNGSKNFRTPSAVPNYFSNEGGPLVGGAAESRRGELYPSQTASGGPQPAERAASPAPAPVWAQTPRARQHFAMAVPHGHTLHGRRGLLVPRHVAVHGRATSHLAAHGTLRGRSVHAVRASHSSARTTRVGATHHRGRA